MGGRGTQRQILSRILEILDNELGMIRGTVVLVSPDNRELIIEVAHNISERQRRTVRYRVGEGVTGRVVETGKPAVVPKVSKEPLFLDRLHKRRKVTNDEISFVCLPILMGRDVIGALSVDRVFDASDSLDEVVRLLSIVARMIANSVRAQREAEAQRQRLEEENVRLRDQLGDRFRPENIIGNCSAMREVYRAIHQVARSQTTVLLLGESGTGKELVAQAIHFASPRAKGPFVRVNCAAFSESLLESELFGHEKGAFTGATEARRGCIEEANGGTLLLDEIGDCAPATQVRLLRVLQEREFVRVGSNRPRKANVRIIAVTNRDLEKAVDSGTFRTDLYYRINVFPIYLPPLRDRKEDIVQLADFFIERYAKQNGKEVRRITTPAINMMMTYHWPGNVRELENCMERAVLLSEDGVIHSHYLPPSLQTSEASDTVGTGTLEERVALFENDILVDALKRSDGSVAAAARELGTTGRVLRYKLRKLNIDFRQFRRPR
jgi:Nif-specific regulatory protein